MEMTGIRYDSEDDSTRGLMGHRVNDAARRHVETRAPEFAWSLPHGRDNPTIIGFAPSEK